VERHKLPRRLSWGFNKGGHLIIKIEKTNKKKLCFRAENNGRSPVRPGQSFFNTSHPLFILFLNIMFAAQQSRANSRVVLSLRGGRDCWGPRGFCSSFIFLGLYKYTCQEWNKKKHFFFHFFSLSFCVNIFFFSNESYRRITHHHSLRTTHQWHHHRGKTNFVLSFLFFFCVRQRANRRTTTLVSHSIYFKFFFFFLFLLLKFFLLIR
jgi:hypothetical protein